MKKSKTSLPTPMSHFETKVPLIDEITVHLVVTDSIKKAHQALDIPYKKSCCTAGGECHMEKRATDIYIFFNEDCLTSDFIGHEIFHATDTILDSIGVEAKFSNDEFGARVNGYLHDWVEQSLKKLT
jgi:hypothetical protein